MAALIIRIEEEHEQHECGQDMVGFRMSNDYDGELQPGDVLPGMRPLLMRAVQTVIDSVWGKPLEERAEVAAEARKQSFIH